MHRPETHPVSACIRRDRSPECSEFLQSRRSEFPLVPEDPRESGGIRSGAGPPAVVVNSSSRGITWNPRPLDTSSRTSRIDAAKAGESVTVRPSSPSKARDKVAGSSCPSKGAAILQMRLAFSTSARFGKRSWNLSLSWAAILSLHIVSEVASWQVSPVSRCGIFPIDSQNFASPLPRQDRNEANAATLNIYAKCYIHETPVTMRLGGELPPRKQSLRHRRRRPLLNFDCISPSRC